MKPTQGPSFGQMLVYDIKSQRLGIFSVILGIVAIGLGIYGLLDKSSNFAGEIFLLIFSFGLAARLIWRFRFLRKIYENGETVRMILKDVTRTGDEISLGGQYLFQNMVYCFSTTIQKTKRTRMLKKGDQIFLIINRDDPSRAYIQDLYTPERPDKIRQPVDKTLEAEIALLARCNDEFKGTSNGTGGNSTYQIKVSESAVDSRKSIQSQVLITRGTNNQSRQLTIHDFQFEFLLAGIFLIVAGIFIYLNSNEITPALVLGVIGLLVLLFESSLFLTITIDKDACIMIIKSLWRGKAIEIPLKELRDIQIEAREGDNGTVYRMIAIKTDGAIIPFRDWYSSGLSSYKKRAVRLCNFIGLDATKKIERSENHPMILM